MNSEQIINNVQCIYPWTSLSIRVKSQVGLCFASYKNIGFLEPWTTLDSIHNHPLRQQHRKLMLEKKSRCNGFCAPNCEYMWCKQTSLINKASCPTPIIKEIMEGKVVLENPPEVIDVNVDNVCNYKCDMCFQTKEEFRVKDRFFSLLNEINNKSQTTFRVVWIGGETLASTWSKEMLIKSCKDNEKMEVCLLSNGSIYDEDFLTQIVLDNVTLSIDSIDEKLYAEIRKGGDLKNVLSNLQKYIDYRNKFEKDFYHFPVSVTCVITSTNYKQLSDIINFFSKYERINLHFRYGMIPNNKIDIFYVAAQNSIIYKEFEKSINYAIDNQNINKFELPHITRDSLTAIKYHLSNYHFQEHGKLYEDIKMYKPC